jgi:hypothetical protein
MDAVLHNYSSEVGEWQLEVGRVDVQAGWHRRAIKRIHPNGKLTIIKTHLVAHQTVAALAGPVGIDPPTELNVDMNIP